MPYALFWNDTLLRRHPTQADAQADLDDCLNRHTETIHKNVKDTTLHAHMIGTFEVRPVEEPVVMMAGKEHKPSVVTAPAHAPETAPRRMKWVPASAEEK